MPIMPRLLITPGIGVPSHPQPLLSHLAPVFFLDLGAALLCLQTTGFRVISIFLRLGRPVHGHPQFAQPAGKASVKPMVPGSLAHHGRVEPGLVEQRQKDLPAHRDPGAEAGRAHRERHQMSLRVGNFFSASVFSVFGRRSRG